MTAGEYLCQQMAQISVPVYMDEYTGTDERYIVYSIYSRPLIFGNDAPAVGLLMVQVHYYCPIDEDPTAVVAQMQAILFRSGFTWPERPVGSMVEGKVRHTVLECESMEAIGLDGGD